MSVGRKIEFSTTDQSYIFNRLVNILPSQELDQQKNGVGYYVLGVMLQYGEGAPQDTNEAYNYLLKASNMGIGAATDMLGRYKKSMFGHLEFKY